MIWAQVEWCSGQRADRTESIFFKEEGDAVMCLQLLTDIYIKIKLMETQKYSGRTARHALVKLGSFWFGGAAPSCGANSIS